MISQSQFNNAAQLLGCSVSAIKAVYNVEANGSGFLDDGLVKGQWDPADRLQILFEGHRFWKGLVKVGVAPAVFLRNNPQYADVLYSVWNRNKYKGGSAEWDRSSRAIEVCKLLGVDVNIALDSASYGAFQIMGENNSECGYANSHDMIAAYNSGLEPEQLFSFCRLVQHRGLDKALKAKDWATFAKSYNGSAYKENRYDIKLAAADKKFSTADRNVGNYGNK